MAGLLVLSSCGGGASGQYVVADQGYAAESVQADGAAATAMSERRRVVQREMAPAPASAGRGRASRRPAPSRNTPMPAPEPGSSPRSTPSNRSTPRAKQPTTPKPQPTARPDLDDAIDAEVGRALEETGAQTSDALIVYMGYLELQVRQRIAAMDAIEALTRELNGYVDSLSGEVVVVRVPAGDFKAAMKRYAELGEVKAHRVQAVDVSAQYTDLEARRGLAEASRARLLALLEKTRDVRERLRIMQEIKRLSEQIEGVDAQLAALQNLLAFYTITIRVRAPSPGAGTRAHRSPFPWVRGLQAHRPTVRRDGTRVKLELPRGFVRFSRRGERVAMQARAADTTVIRAGRTDNEPRGDAAFWLAAVRHEMTGRNMVEKDHGEVQTPLGTLRWALFANKTLRPLGHLIGVVVPKGDGGSAGPDVWVTEVFFPRPAALQRHGDAAKKALGTLEVRP